MTRGMNLGKNVAPDARSTKGFVNSWETPDRKTLIDGSEDEKSFPKMSHRQDRLVGDVLDACVILHIYEQLKQGATVASLSFFFPGGNLTQDEVHKLEAGSREVRLQTLMDISQEGRPDKRMLTHRYMIQQPAWNYYHKAFAGYESNLETYKKGAIEYIGSQGSLEGFRRPPVMPPDPRISATNEHIRGTIQLLNPGPKDLNALDKKGRRKDEDVTKLRDMNRVGVQIRKPAYVEDFVTIMEMLYPPKHITHDGKGRDLDRMYDEGAEIHENGFYNRKLFLALDRTGESDNSKTRGNLAAYAEVQIKPPSMQRAEKLSAVLKSLKDDLQDPAPYMITSNKPGHKERVQNERNLLKKRFIEKRTEFYRLIGDFRKEDKDYAPKYKFPAFPNDEALKQHATLVNLRQELVAISLRIHVDAIKTEERDWQREYVNTGLKQWLRMTERGYRKDSRNVLNKQFDRDQKHRTVQYGVLEEVAGHNSWDIKEIERKLKEEMTQEKWKKPAGHEK